MMKFSMIHPLHKNYLTTTQPHTQSNKKLTQIEDQLGSPKLTQSNKKLSEFCKNSNHQNSMIQKLESFKIPLKRKELQILRMRKPRFNPQKI